MQYKRSSRGSLYQCNSCDVFSNRNLNLSRENLCQPSYIASGEILTRMRGFFHLYTYSFTASYTCLYIRILLCLPRNYEALFTMERSHGYQLLHSSEPTFHTACTMFLRHV
ncbi:hypothetical protein M431DRAFT_224420 [Trichoderma harzianum CBS 226.95]|uniref:Uncharacterized protein n=1 Tax=Trichoderma harzianum CBS 226.95 TaxID=983964 RepID=A0A2T4A3J5_TRIHA|nr:hypothetical protein M431DRAFT_224420 [Trichoderma harzianum CBS 226.95]PTB51647.1 hypothetical protein M431DRAFT_224420 [Trichoderma harzianum CBS 226.95]